MLSFLSHTYTSSFYGADTRYTFISANGFDKISILYHRSVKKVAGLQVWGSNHEGCDVVKVPISKHLLLERIICFCNASSVRVLTRQVDSNTISDTVLNKH